MANKDGMKPDDVARSCDRRASSGRQAPSRYPGSPLIVVVSASVVCGVVGVLGHPAPQSRRVREGSTGRQAAERLIASLRRVSGAMKSRLA